MPRSRSRRRVAIALLSVLILAGAALTIVLIFDDEDVVNGVAITDIVTAPGTFEGQEVQVRGEVAAVGARGFAITTPGSRESLLVIPLTSSAPANVTEGQGYVVEGVVRPFDEAEGFVPPNDRLLAEATDLDEDAALLATEIEPAG